MAPRKRLLLATYDLSVATEEQRAAIYEALKSSDGWWHHIDSTWLLFTDKTPEQLVDRMTPHLTKSNRLLIIEVKPNYQGWLPEKAWKWIGSVSSKKPPARF
jgi:hypothetical protein